MYYNRAAAKAACGQLQGLVDKIRLSATVKKKKLPPLPVKPLSLDDPEE